MNQMPNPSSDDADYVNAFTRLGQSIVEQRRSEKKLAETTSACLRSMAEAIHNLRLQLRAMQELVDIDPEALAAKVAELRADDAAYQAEKELLRDSLADDPD